MKRNLLLIVAVALAIVATMLAGNVIVIGDRLARLHPWAEWAFYAIVVVLVLWFVARPIWRVHHAPEFPRLGVDGDVEPDELRRFARRLADNCYYIADDERRRAHQLTLRRQLAQYGADVTELKAIVAAELARRIDGDKEQGVPGINGRIRQWATSVFMVTAVSQSAKFDSLSVMYFNYKMIEDIIRASGFRPTGQQLFRQYIRILTTSLITYYANEVLTDMDDIAPFAGADDVAADTGGWTFMGALRKLRIPGIMVGSVADGAVNALLTLRIGYVTRSYLLRGSAALTSNESRRTVRREDAVRAIPSIVSSGSAALGRGIGAAVGRLFADDEAQEKAEA